MRVVVDSIGVYINSTFLNLEGLVLAKLKFKKCVCQNSLVFAHLNNLEGSSFIDGTDPNRSFAASWN